MHRAELALSGVYEISKLLSAPVRLEAKLAGVLTLLSSFLDMQHGLVALLRSDGTPETVVGSGWSEATAKRYFEHLPERAIGQIVATRAPLVVVNVADDPLFMDWRASEPGAADMVCSFIGVPIKDDDRVVGTLTIERVWEVRSQLWLDEDVRFLTMITNLIGQSVQLHNVIARDRERLMLEQHRLEKALSDTSAPDNVERAKGIVGNSPAIRAVLDKIRIVARSNSTVLLRGESGTGKEMFARAIHDLSRRKAAPFVKLNCAALPEGVLESELFGHEKGAFTGAVGQRKGRFELADGGTLFLDEIGEISAAFQGKLLRVLQEGEFERVGGTRTLKVDVRLVCATNRNLEDAVSRGDFRADLYYRIAVVLVSLPPLRERAGDVPLLANEFLRQFNQENGTELKLEPAGLAVLAACHFPGNVRELENCVRRTATFARGQRIADGDFACRNDVCLSATLWKGPSGAAPAGFTPLPVVTRPPKDAAVAPSAPPAARRPPVQSDAGRRDAIADDATGPPPAPRRIASPDDDSERQSLIDAMEAAGWVKAKAARLLGVTTRQIAYALRKHNIPVRKFRFAREVMGDDDAADGPEGDDVGPATASDDDSERQSLIEAMEAAGWVKAKAARLLGVTTRQIAYALQKYNIEVRKL